MLGAHAATAAARALHPAECVGHHVSVTQHLVVMCQFQVFSPFPSTALESTGQRTPVPRRVRTRPRRALVAVTEAVEQPY